MRDTKNSQVKLSHIIERERKKSETILLFLPLLLAIPFRLFQLIFKTSSTSTDGRLLSGSTIRTGDLCRVYFFHLSSPLFFFFFFYTLPMPRVSESVFSQGAVRKKRIVSFRVETTHDDEEGELHSSRSRNGMTCLPAEIEVAVVVLLKCQRQ